MFVFKGEHFFVYHDGVAGEDPHRGSIFKNRILPIA